MREIFELEATIASGILESKPKPNSFMKRLSLLLVVFLCATFVAHSQDWAKAKLEKSPRHQEWVKLKHGSREVQCFVVYPEVKEKATTIVLIHDYLASPIGREGNGR